MQTARRLWRCFKLLGICCGRPKLEVEETVLTDLNIWACEVKIRSEWSNYYNVSVHRSFYNFAFRTRILKVLCALC